MHIKFKHSSEKFVQSTIISAYECYMCKNGKIYKKKCYLKRHLDRNHQINDEKSKIQPNKDVSCEVCGKVFHCIANKKRHIKVIHLNQRLFVCRICSKRFGSLLELENHEPLHSDEKNLQCTNCEEKFKTKAMVQRHIRAEHMTFELTEEQRLKRDLDIVKRRRAYNNKNRKCCEICGKTMVYNLLEGHMRTHFGIKPYKCTMCPKTFLNKLRLNQHTLVHTGEKPYKCDLCDKSFRQKSHVYQHRRIHTGEKPYKCSYCGRAFATSGNLREHERLHSGETPYRCNMCTEKFVNSKALKRHASQIHSGHESEACIYTLPSSNNL